MDEAPSAREQAVANPTSRSEKWDAALQHFDDAIGELSELPEAP